MVTNDQVKQRLKDYVNSPSGQKYLLQTDPNTRYEAWWLVSCLSNILLLNVLDESGTSQEPKLTLIRRRRV